MTYISLFDYTFSTILEALGTKGVFNFRGEISEAEWKIAR